MADWSAQTLATRIAVQEGGCDDGLRAQKALWPDLSRWRLRGRVKGLHGNPESVLTYFGGRPAMLTLVAIATAVLIGFGLFVWLQDRRPA